MTPSPALGFLEIYGHYFKSSEGGIDGRTLRGFHAASVLEFIDKYLGINDAETADFLKQHLGRSVASKEGDWEFWIDLDDYGQNLEEREESEDGFWYEGKASAGSETFLMHPDGRSFPYVSGRFRPQEWVQENADDPATKRIVTLLDVLSQIWDDDASLLELTRLWLVEEARDLRGIQLGQFSAAEVGALNLDGVRYDNQTTWPEGFDPDVAGAVRA